MRAARDASVMSVIASTRPPSPNGARVIAIRRSSIAISRLSASRVAGPSRRSTPPATPPIPAGSWSAQFVAAARCDVEQLLGARVGVDHRASIRRHRSRRSPRSTGSPRCARARIRVAAALRAQLLLHLVDGPEHRRELGRDVRRVRQPVRRAPMASAVRRRVSIGWPSARATKPATVTAAAAPASDDQQQQQCQVDIVPAQAPNRCRAARWRSASRFIRRARCPSARSTRAIRRARRARRCRGPRNGCTTGGRKPRSTSSGVLAAMSRASRYTPRSASTMSAMRCNAIGSATSPDSVRANPPSTATSRRARVTSAVRATVASPRSRSSDQRVKNNAGPMKNAASAVATVRRYDRRSTLTVMVLIATEHSFEGQPCGEDHDHVEHHAQRSANRERARRRHFDRCARPPATTSPAGTGQSARIQRPERRNVLSGRASRSLTTIETKRRLRHRTPSDVAAEPGGRDEPRARPGGDGGDGVGGQWHDEHLMMDRAAPQRHAARLGPRRSEPVRLEVAPRHAQGIEGDRFAGVAVRAQQRQVRRQAEPRQRPMRATPRRDDRCGSRGRLAQRSRMQSSAAVEAESGCGAWSRATSSRARSMRRSSVLAPGREGGEHTGKGGDRAHPDRAGIGGSKSKASGTIQSAGTRSTSPEGRHASMPTRRRPRRRSAAEHSPGSRGMRRRHRGGAGHWRSPGTRPLIPRGSPATRTRW